MTTIVAIEHGDRVEWAFDSQATGGDKFWLSRPKVVRKGEFTFGLAGSVGLMNALTYNDFPVWHEDIAPEKWLTTKFVPFLKELDDDTQSPHTQEGEDTGSTVLLELSGRVFEIDSDYQWYQNVDGQYAIGSGGHFALGALSMGATALEAVGVAAKRDPYTGYALSTTPYRKW